MGNLRPPPAALTGARVSQILQVMDARAEDTIVHTLGLSDSDIALIRSMAAMHGVTPLHLMGSMISAALDALEVRAR